MLQYEHNVVLELVKQGHPEPDTKVLALHLSELHAIFFHQSLTDLGLSHVAAVLQNLRQMIGRRYICFCCRWVQESELYKCGSMSRWSQHASICFVLMGLMTTSALESAYASCSQSGVKRIKGSQIISWLGAEEGEVGPQLGVVMGLGLQVHVVAGVVAEDGGGPEAVAGSRQSPKSHVLLVLAYQHCCHQQHRATLLHEAACDSSTLNVSLFFRCMHA